MKILVTGGSGFLGTTLLHHLKQNGHVAAGFSRTRIPGSITGDITQTDSIENALDDFSPEVIVNLASQTDLDGNGHAGYAANTIGVQNLVDAVTFSSSVRRVIWASSQLVNIPGYQPGNDEDYNPVGAYGRSKMMGERIIRSRDGGGKEWTIIRPTTVWGPGMSPHYLRLLSMIHRGMYFHVGYKPLRKSYSYIGNLVHQLGELVTADRQLMHRKTIYVADSEPIELHAWCNGFAKRFGKSIPTMPKIAACLLAKAGDAAGMMGVKRFPFNSARLNNILTEYVFDTAGIEAVCGKSRISNTEGVRRTAEWFLSLQPHGERRLRPRAAPAY